MRIKSSSDRREPHETFRRCDGGEGRCVRNAFVPPSSPPSTPIFSSCSVSLPAEEPVCASAAALYVTTYPLCSTVLSYVPFPLPAMCPPGKFQKSYNHSRLPRRWRTCEYPIFMASHFLLFSPVLFDFLRELAVRSSFDFSPMFAPA